MLLSNKITSLSEIVQFGIIIRNRTKVNSENTQDRRKAKDGEITIKNVERSGENSGLLEAYLLSYKSKETLTD